MWASLAIDYLPIMASSVSSERAFSAAGITITKRRNRLGADIVEALQFLKCFFCRDLIFREDPSVALEHNPDHTQGSKDSWDGTLLAEDGEDQDAEISEEPDGDDDDDVFLYQPSSR